MSANHVPVALFRLGRIVTTPAALGRLSHDDILAGIQRHQAGDWGDLCEEDKRENQFALEKGFRLFSTYLAVNGVKFYVITEADRSVTTILLPEDY